jgi:hypothetical protein
MFFYNFLLKRFRSNRDAHMSSWKVSVTGDRFLLQLEYINKFLAKLPSTKFRENLFGCYRDVACCRTEWRRAEANNRTLATFRCRRARKKNERIIPLKTMKEATVETSIRPISIRRIFGQSTTEHLGRMSRNSTSYSSWILGPEADCPIYGKCLYSTWTGSRPLPWTSCPVY